MKRTKTKTEPAVPAKPEREVVVDDGVACDICKAHHPKARVAYNGIVDWATGYDKSATALLTTTGTVFPEGPNLNTCRFDICPPCMEKVFGYLATLGAEPTEVESD